MEDVNRLKIVLVEKKKTSKWLAEQLDVNPSTVSKWCTNTSQPPLETLIQISQLLKVEVTELICVPQKQITRNDKYDDKEAVFPF